MRQEDISRIKDVITEYAKVGIDAASNSNLIKQLPILKTFIGLLAFKDAIAEYLFEQKILNFLNRLKDIPKYKIEKELVSIDNNQKYKQKVGNKILEILSRIDSDEKPRIFGNLFRNFILGKIDYEYFLKLTHILERGFYYELLFLTNYDEKGHIYDGDSIELQSLGLTSSILFSDMFELGYKGAITNLGIDFVKYGMRNG